MQKRKRMRERERKKERKKESASGMSGHTITPEAKNTSSKRNFKLLPTHSVDNVNKGAEKRNSR